MTKPHPRGGTRPGAGRPRLSPSTPTVTLTIRLPATLRDRLRAAGITDAQIRAALTRLIKNQAR